MEFEKKNNQEWSVLITGAGKGIGYELVKVFLSNPDIRVIATSRNVTQLRAIESKRLQIIEGDLTDDFQEIVKQINLCTDTIKILINNAAIVTNSLIQDTNDKQISELMETNFVVPYKLIRDLLPKFEDGTHIVNISSMSGFQGSKKFNGLSLYSSSKAALGALSECIAAEFSEKGIFCNCLALGAVDTGMIKISIPEMKSMVNAEQMARYIYGFALNGNLYFNGQILPVDRPIL